MRIVQLIDSLEAGGAERMAVNYANALVHEVEFSGLVATRHEGSLKDQLHKNSKYFFLGRKSTFDIFALLRLRRFITTNRITHIHAHSSSFLIATLVKMVYPKVKIVWHDHYGNSEFLSQRNFRVLRLCSVFFYATIVVNEKLKIWAIEKLNCSKIAYFPNFVNLESSSENLTDLKGNDGKRILCLANLREQKNHDLLLDIAVEIKKTNPDWTFHLVGKDFEDGYSKRIKALIESKGLEKSVFVYGSRDDVANILEQSSIGILTSKSEGLPVALLEYGFHKLPVIVSAVGEIPSVVKNGVNGYIVMKNSKELFVEAIERLISDASLRQLLGNELGKTIDEGYTEKALLKKYIQFIT